MRLYFFISKYDTEFLIPKICARYPIEVKYNGEQAKILTAKFINDIFMLIYLLEFKIQKNSHAHYRSFKTRRTRELPTIKGLHSYHFWYGFIYSFIDMI